MFEKRANLKRSMKVACQALANTVVNGVVEIVFEKGSRLKDISVESEGGRDSVTQADFESAKFLLLSKLWASQKVKKLQMSLVVTRNENIIFTANIPHAEQNLKTMTKIADGAVGEIGRLAFPISSTDSASRYFSNITR